MDSPLSKTSVRRAIYSILLVIGAEVVGTVGFHVLENASWINAFYFESMLATGQGPPFTLVTNAGKIFASIMAFVSVGSVLGAVLFTVGPIVIRLWHEGRLAVEAEARRLEKDVLRDVRTLEREITPGKAPSQRPPNGPPI